MTEHSDSAASQYHMNDRGEFIIADYNSARPFSSFLPGIAGIDGRPLWVFYVNRGQCICSMGTQDKNHAIMEFLPANRAYNLTSSLGFRTFLKLSGGPNTGYYEPFQNHYRDSDLERSQRMIISPSGLTIEEVNRSLNLRFTVDYYTVAEDNYPGLVRVLRIENTGSRRIELEGLDGLPVIVPYGVDDFCLKSMRRTIEAFVEVRNLDHKAPFFKTKVEPADRPDVKVITQGNFYVGFEYDGTEGHLLDPIVDPGRIFGAQTDYSVPEGFLATRLEELVHDQIVENQLPCAMGMLQTSIPPSRQHTYATIIGHAFSQEKLNAMLPRISTGDYIDSRAKANRETIEALTQKNLICSREPALDFYVRQNFLDNLLRGGFPITLAGKHKRSTLYLYSRKHGDLERDYNDFRLMPTRYSQGNGNFRDINQNRRSDLLFNPDVQEENVEYFYGLIQLDGFNPLVLGETRFVVVSMEEARRVTERCIDSDRVQEALSFMEAPFTPGGLLEFFDEHDIALHGDSRSFMGELLDHCSKSSEVTHGEGFWIDHWTYNLDLLESYRAVYPDRFRDLLFDCDRFTFYDSPYRVLPRSDKYVLWEGEPRQLDAVVLDEAKLSLIDVRKRERNRVRVEFGQGDVYRTSLFTKLLCLIVNKLSSLDPEGVGVEMEADKPGWYDALNGLPGLFGSSVCETLEIKRHIRFLLRALDEFEDAPDEISVFEELSELMDTMHCLLAQQLPSLEFWNEASTARESYRDKTRMGVSGKEIGVELRRVIDFFEAALRKLEFGIEKARDGRSGTLFTYFRYEVTDYQVIESPPSGEVVEATRVTNGPTRVAPSAFKQVPLPLFLEGPVHYLRCNPDAGEAAEFAASVKKSALYDECLKMYKVNAPLTDEPMGIGRSRVFSPGWLENESIWLHMEYKYLLELLRNGLYDEFYRDFRNVCIPFLDPAVYGRSTLENSSFIASSAHPNPLVHGNGFVARLSGATAEFIHMLLLMTVGTRPFRLGPDGQLELRLEPALPEWLFTRETRNVRVLKQDEWEEIELPARTFSFMFLGSILVVYHNEGLSDTFGEDGVKPVEWTIVDSKGNTQTLYAETLIGDFARRVRDREVTRMDIVLR